MQTDEDVGKVAAAVPIIISRALEMFIESLIKETSKTTIAKNAKTLSTAHIKQTIHSNKQYDFLRDLVANVPDHNSEDIVGNANGNSTGDTTQGNGDIPQKRKRGRPPKAKETAQVVGRKPGQSSKASPETSDDDDQEEEEDEEDETESEDEVKPSKLSAVSSNHTTRSLQNLSTSSLSYKANENKPGFGTLAGNSTEPQNYPTHLPPGYSVPAPASLAMQQQQLHLHQQMMMAQQQHQLTTGSLSTSSSSSTFSHPYLPPTHLTTPNPSSSTNIYPPGGLGGYPIPPQLQYNPYYPNAVPMMPLAHQHQPLPGMSGFQGMTHPMPAGLHPTPAPQAQVQPINLSTSSQQGSCPRNEADDYDS